MNIPPLLTALGAVVFAGSLQAQDGQNMLGRQTQNEGIFAVPAAKPVKVDGKLEEWDLSGQIWSYGDTSVRDTFSVKTAAMWDADNLYLSWVWRDPMPLNSTVNPKFDAERGWTADAVQMRVLAGAQPSWFTVWGFEKGMKPAVHVHYWGSEASDKGGSTVLHHSGVAGETALGEGIESAYRLMDDGKGFVHEMKLPWKVVYNREWKGAADQTIRMGLEFLWGNQAGQGSPMHRYADNMQPGVISREFYWSNKKAWGDLTTLSTSLKEPRRYVEGSLRPKGSIPVRVRVPAGASNVSVVIDDLEGNRVRNLAGGFAVADLTVAREGDTATLELMWDGLDESGALVKPGAYKVRGLTHGGVQGFYEMSFYNPGTPAWQTTDKKGAWGADHTAPRLVARAGDLMIVTCDFAEGGYGTFALKADGTKAWSEIRGANVLAANRDFVFTVPNDWGVSGVQLLRMHAHDGSFAPFVREGRELPMPLHFRDLLQLGTPAGGAAPEALPKARALAVGGGIIALATDDHRLWLLDAATGALLKQTTLELSEFGKKVPFAFDGKQLWYFRNSGLVRVSLDALKNDPAPASKAVSITLGVPVSQPGAITLDADGNLFISDMGGDLQVKKFAPDGRLLGRFGKTGGRARQGTFEADGMRAMEGIAVDGSGNLWVTEYSTKPRRVSVWNPDGSLKRDFIGNTGYAGQGSFLHDSDPTRGFAELNEIKLDPATRKWTMEGVMYNPDPAKGDFVQPGSTAFGSGNVFFSEASGARHEYFVSLGETRNTPVFVMIKSGQAWLPVAGIFTVANLQGLLGGQYGSQIVRDPSGAYAENDPSDMLIWNDFNNDGYVQKDECEVVPSLKKHRMVNGKPMSLDGLAVPVGGFGGGARVDPGDFSFYATGVLKSAENKGLFRVKPLRFRDGGRPVLGTGGFEVVPADFDLLEAVPFPGKDLAVGFIKTGTKVFVAGFTKSTGRVLWKYASPFHQVHGSHNAPMPRPGLLIGCLKIMGIVPSCGQADGVVMIRGNLGEDYFLTTDGVFVDILTKDGRIPGIQKPEGERELRAVSFSSLSGRGEHFSGVISRQADGVIRCSGAMPADQAGNIVRIEGLDSIRRFSGPDLAVTEGALVRADHENTERALAAAKSQEPYTILPVQRDAKGQVDLGRAKPLRISNEGQPVSGDFRAAYDMENLYVQYAVSDPSPWKNSGNEYSLLFKTGDCVDLQLSPGGNKGAKAVEGDLRVVMANFNGKPAAVLMKPVAPGAPVSDRHSFSSPVMSVAFDQVRLLTEVVPEVAVRPNGYTVRATLPWSVLGLAPKANLQLTGDVGFILSDPSGTINAARVYWSNKNTNLVNDQPSEAQLQPRGFGEFVLGKE